MDLTYLENYNGDYTVALIDQTNHLFEQIRVNKKVIGTYDHNRKPQSDDEIIVIIGDYPVSKSSTVISNPMYRNYKWALDFSFDVFESSHPCFDPIDEIWVINSEERPDRLFDTLKEFKKMQVPLNKVKIQKAITDFSTGNQYVNGLLGCFRSHLSAQLECVKKDFNHVLIFEDDFTFSDPMEENKQQLQLFFERNYEYDVLLFATSAIDTIEPKDDLISITRQACTTASGYLLSRKGLTKVIPIWIEGISGLLQTCDFNTYACDRYWSKLQSDDKMFVFKRKIGYQKPSYSTTLKSFVYNLD